MLKYYGLGVVIGSFISTILHFNNRHDIIYRKINNIDNEINTIHRKINSIDSNIKNIKLK